MGPGGTRVFASFDTIRNDNSGRCHDVARRLRLVLLAVVASFTTAIAPGITAGASMPTSPEATWTRVSPATSPPVRDSASMAYDSATGSVVLFGGANGGSDLNDTWTFNGVTWTRLSPSIRQQRRPQ